MTRKKVKLTYITNDPTRKVTFKKRKKGLIKKLREITTLCGVEACAVIYSQYDYLPDVFPSPLGVKRVVAQFRTMPGMEQTRKMVNQESFLRQRIAKANEQLKRLRKENREKEVTKAMFECLTGKSLEGLTFIDLNDIGWLIDQRLKDIDCKIKSLKEEAAAQLRNQAAPTPSVVLAEADQNMMNMQAAMERQTSELNLTNMDNMQRPPWFEMSMNTTQEHMGFGAAGDEILPFGDLNHHANWANSPYFP